MFSAGTVQSFIKNSLQWCRWLRNTIILHLNQIMWDLFNTVFFYLYTAVGELCIWWIVLGQLWDLFGVLSPTVRLTCLCFYDHIYCLEVYKMLALFSRCVTDIIFHFLFNFKTSIFSNVSKRSECTELLGLNVVIWNWLHYNMSCVRANVVE